MFTREEFSGKSLGSILNANSVARGVFAIGLGAGVMFSLITATGSIWTGALSRAIWNLVICGGILWSDVAPSPDALYTYKLASNSSLFTGGSFAVEASIFAVVAYLLVVAWAWKSRSRRTV